MKLVIEIPEKTYHMINDNIYNYGDMNVIIQNGIPLDKHDEEIIAETVESIWGKPPYTDILDKIRAEIEIITNGISYIDKNKVFEIIRKYTGEGRYVRFT